MEMKTPPRIVRTATHIEQRESSQTVGSTFDWLVRNEHVAQRLHSVRMNLISLGCRKYTRMAGLLIHHQVKSVF